MFGTGSAGSLTPTPDCPRLQFVTVQDDAYVCAPTSLPVPEGTVALSLDAPCPVSGNLETAFTQSSEMKTLLECILPIAVDWLSWEYQDETLAPPSEWKSLSQSLLPLDFIYVPANVVVEEAFGGQHCGGYDSTTALHYCPQDGNIYFGEELLWFTYTNYGDADLWGSISHEMGHRVQHVAGADRSNPDVPNEQIPAENQADCFSGAFLDFAARNHYIDVTVTGDDLVDLFDGLFNIGEPAFEGRSHGTIDQRIRAFFVGYNSADDWGCSSATATSRTQRSSQRCTLPTRRCSRRRRLPLRNRRRPLQRRRSTRRTSTPSSIVPVASPTIAKSWKSICAWAMNCWRSSPATGGSGRCFTAFARSRKRSSISSTSKEAMPRMYPAELRRSTSSSAQLCLLGLLA